VLLHLDSALRMIDSPAIYAFRKFDMKESLRKPVVKALGCYQAALRRQHNGSRRGSPRNIASSPARIGMRVRRG
jgi:hypothetical protein